MPESPLDPAASADTGGEAGMGPDPEPTTGPPLWVKAFVIVALVLVLVVVVVAIAGGGGGHGPGRHMP